MPTGRGGSYGGSSPAHRKVGGYWEETRAGRPPKLRGQACTELDLVLLAEAHTARSTADLWTCPQVAKLISSGFRA